MTNLFTPLTRSLAIASLTGAAFFAGPVMAQTATTPDGKVTPPAAAAAISSKPETVEQRITMLKTSLKITPDQEKKWDAVAQSMRDNASAMEKLVATKRAIPPEKTTAVDDLKTYQAFSQARLDGLKNLISAFSTLYDSMPADQKKNADHVFDSYGPPKSGQQG